ncbi:MAG: M20 family metallopeptidase [Rhodocyclaceae bacterium]|nr:M20 family metallopeptidase [Rhodocyclaceae bacterium]
MPILEILRARQQSLAGLRRDLHAHPETAFEEQRTSDVVADYLEQRGIEVHRGLARTGVVGVLKAGSGSRAIGLRADMDALPMDERNSFPHHSRHPGKMHACGHDGHTTMLLAAAEYLAETKNFDGTAYFIFQPAEESLGGGRVMVEEGLFRRFPMEAVFGLHNWPGLPAGTLAVHAGPVMAGSDEFEIVITGHGAHGAMPHQGVDPVVVGAALVQALQTVVSRSVDPLEAAVVSVTQFHAGHATNVIPDEAILRGTARAFRPEVQDTLEATMQRLCNGVAAAFNAGVALHYKRGYPPTINTLAEAETCRRVAAIVLGQDQVRTDMKPTMGAEDFSFMLREKPGCYVWLGNGPGEGGCMLHNPHYDFNDDLIPIGASYWVGLVEHILEAGLKQGPGTRG